MAINSIRDFFRDKPFVFFGTGMSCALDARFGMPALKDELSQRITPDAQAPEQEPTMAAGCAITSEWRRLGVCARQRY